MSNAKTKTTEMEGAAGPVSVTVVLNDPTLADANPNLSLGSGLGKIPVTFVDKYPPYNAGETAGFDEAGARALINLGIAVPYGEEPEFLVTNETNTSPEANKMARVTAARYPVSAGVATDIGGMPVGGVQTDHFQGLLTQALRGEGIGDVPRPEARLNNLRGLAIDHETLKTLPKANAQVMQDQAKGIDAALTDDVKEKDDAVKAAQEQGKGPAGQGEWQTAGAPTEKAVDSPPKDKMVGPEDTKTK